VSIFFIFISVSSFISFGASAMDYFYEGNNFINSGKYLEAIDSYDKAIKINPDIPEFHYNKAIALYNLGRYDEAIAQYDQVIKLNSKFKEAYINKALCLTETSRFDESITLLDEYIKKYPNDAEGYALKGHNLLLKGSYSEALEMAQKVIDIKPKDKIILSMAYSTKSSALNELGRVDEALEACKAALELDNTNANAYIAMGYSFYIQKKYDEAIEMCNKAIEVMPNCVEAYMNKSVFLTKKEIRRSNRVLQ